MTPNDSLSFTVHNIISGADDNSYDSGVSATEAHHSILQRYSFYVALAQKISDAKQ
jgi:hypothetical protein